MILERAFRKGLKRVVKSLSWPELEKRAVTGYIYNSPLLMCIYLSSYTLRSLPKNVFPLPVTIGKVGVCLTLYYAVVAVISRSFWLEMNTVGLSQGGVFINLLQSNGVFSLGVDAMNLRV